MLTKRTQTIKDSLFAQPRKVTMERARMYMESYKKTEGEVPIIRRAKALQHVLENHKIIFDENDLLVGNRTDSPRAGVVSPEMSPYWIMDELDAFPIRQQDRFDISEEDKTYYREVLYPFWRKRSLNDWYSRHLESEVVEAQKTKIFAVAQTDKGQGHIICDFPLILSRGYKVILEEAQSLSTQHPDNPFYQAAVIVLKAVIAYVHRYEEFVQAAIGSTSDAQRKAELTRLAKILRRIAEDPAPQNEHDSIFALHRVSPVFCGFSERFQPRSGWCRCRGKRLY